jgi:hypothetical protein
MQKLSVRSYYYGLFSGIYIRSIACKWMLKIVKRGKLVWFALYCAIVGLRQLFILNFLHNISNLSDLMINESTNFLEGQLLLIDKYKEWTSFDVVNKIRSQIKYRRNIPKIKVGHAGTLDPLATGLLIVCTGKKQKSF